MRWKLTSRTEPETLSIRVKRNVLSVESEAADHPYSGEIVMNEQLIESGRGHYSQTFGEDVLWGLWDVQLQDADTILVHRTYAHHEQHAAVVSGFVWKRIAD